VWFNLRPDRPGGSSLNRALILVETRRSLAARMSSRELPTARSPEDEHADAQVGDDEEAEATAGESARARLPSSSRRSTLRPAPEDFRPSVAATAPRAPMVIVYSGDSVHAPDWVAGSARPPSEPPLSEGPRSESPESEPFVLARALEEQSPASAESARVQPEGVGWHDSELGSGSRPVLSLRAEGVGATSDRLTPLGPPWSEPAPPLRVTAPAAPPKATSRLHLWAALSGSALLAIGYFVLYALGPERPPAAESARPEPARHEPARHDPARHEPKSEQAQPQPAPGAPAASSLARRPPTDVGEAKAAAATPALAPARPAAPAKAAASKAVSVPDAASSSTRVRLEVIPADAQVGRRGFTQKGPPYYFDVPKGKRVELEVVRKGYVTRKVTLDGRSPRVVVGLAKARAAKR
jgi:hypothetical protein